jgi:hypothetical protein
MKRVVLVASLTYLAVAGWRFARACAPDFLRAVFSYSRHPDLPRSEFIDGRLGVLQPTFARSYLVIAYRHLNGIGMNAREREQARDYYKDRDTGAWDHMGTDWPAQWRTVRSQIRSPQPPRTTLITGGQLAYDPETHSFALNCAEDAFRVAIHTLSERRSQFGDSSQAFRSWVAAQDAVFRNCDGGKAEIPEADSAGLPPLIRADREYQIAAAHFYAREYPAALDRFRRIGQDAASPWNTISRYLVVRTLLRMTEDANGAKQAGAQLQTEATGILSDPKAAPVHGMTWNLVARAGIRERDQLYFRELARLLSSRGQDNGLREELWNYTDIYDRIIGDADPNSYYRSSKQVATDVSRFRDADLSDWIFSFQSRDSAVFAHCLDRWQQTRSLAWLLAALSHTNAAGAGGAGLLDAAVAIPATSPAYLTAQFHLLRMAQERGERPAARDRLDALLSSDALKRLPSSTNLFRGLRMLTAPNLDDFIRFASRSPVMVTLQVDFGEVPGFLMEEGGKPQSTADLFDADATRVLNRETPFRFLKAAALNNSLPPGLQREALLTAFTRGLMLGEDISDIARQLAAMRPEFAALANVYLHETTDDGRRFAAAFLLLHHPEARPYFASGISRQSRPGKIDQYRDNWWCPMDIEIDLDSRVRDQWYESPPNLLQRPAGGVTPEFLSGSAAGEAKREMDKLGTLHAATDFLGRIVLQFGKSHGDDARVPEALYCVVRAGRFGCADVDTWQTTRAAFRMLHLRYPKSSWAKRMPTWHKESWDIRRVVKHRQENR